MSKIQQNQQIHAQKNSVKANKAQQKPKAFNPAQMFESPESMRSEDVLTAQQQVGNQVVQRSLDNTVQRDDEELKSLGGGSLNEVYRATRRDGPTGYFKPNNPKDPKMGAKAVLSSDVNEVLGLDSLAKETYKKYSGKKLGTKKAMEGAESEEVPGTTLFEQEFNQQIDKDSYEAYSGMMPNMVKQKDEDGEKKYLKHTGTRHIRHDYANPQTQKDLANLQLQDSITGQFDRHGGNIRIDDSTGRAKGYDSDMMLSSVVGNDSLSNIPGLRKPKGRAMTEDEKQIQQQARITAMQRVNKSHDKNLGLPTHIDQQSALTLVNTNSTSFMKALEKKNKKNMKRLDPEHMKELQLRYSATRRYAKAGLAAAHPELITDEAKRAKWSSPEYQQMVKDGAGHLPSIVSEWGAKSYNEQVNAPDKTDRQPHNTYLQRSVKSYNEALHDNTAANHAEGSDQGALPTNIPETPWQRATDKASRRHGRVFKNPGALRTPMAIGQRPPRTVPQPPPIVATNPQTPTEEDEVLMQSESQEKRQRVTNAKGELVPEINQAIQRKRGGGASLPENVRREAKRILGQDFKDVRIHTDSEAHHLSRSISARAFTIGKDIFFKQGVFSPGSQAGRETLIHELTHVVQQSRGGKASSGNLKLGAPDTAHEKEADQIGKKHASAITSVNASVQRATDEDELQMQPEEEEIQMQGEEDELMMQGDDDDWETDSEPVKPSKPEPVSREKMSELSGNLVGQMKAGAISQGLAKSNIPKAPPPPIPKRPKRPSKGGFSEEIAQKAQAMSGAKQRRNLEKLEGVRSEKVGKRVSEQYKEDQAQKPKSLGQRIKAGAKKAGKQAGKFGLSMLKDFGKSQLGSYSKNFLGTNLVDKYGKFKEKQDEEAKEKEKEKEKEELKGKSGGGIGAVMEQYSELLQENKKLKEQLASLKG